MATPPRVSIGIPFLNEEKVLLNAIRSVFAQTFQDWELILADDGSTDGSLEIARSIDDPRIRVISDGRNLRIPGRLNNIHREATGTYIARMDADDLMHPRRLEEQVAFLDAHPEVDLVGTLMYAMDDHRGIHGIEGHPNRLEPRQTLDRPVLMHATAMGRAEWFRKHLYDESYTRNQDDRDLWCRTCATSVIMNIPKPLYLVDESGISVRSFMRGRVEECRYIRTYGPELVGWPGTILRLIRAHVKGLAFAAFGLFGRQDVLVRMKSQPVTPEQKAEAEAALAQIMATEVPIRVA